MEVDLFNDLDIKQQLPLVMQYSGHFNQNMDLQTVICQPTFQFEPPCNNDINAHINENENESEIISIASLTASPNPYTEGNISSDYLSSDCDSNCDIDEISTDHNGPISNKRWYDTSQDHKELNNVTSQNNHDSNNIHIEITSSCTEDRGDDDERNSNNGNKTSRSNHQYHYEEDDHKKKQEMTTKLNVNAEQFKPSLSKKFVKLALDTIDEDEEEEKTKPIKFSSSRWDSLPIKCAGTVEIPRNLTQNIIPSTIKEHISNIYYFMDKSMALRANRKTLEIEKLIIINYDFHDKNTDEILYCIIKKQDPTKNRGFNWIMMDRLFTKKDILNEFNISEKELSRILPKSSRFDTKILQQMDYIHQLYDILQTQLMLGIIERTQWHRIPIYNKTNNRKRKVLYLTKKEFMNSIEYFITNNKHINIIPVMILNGNKEYWIEYVYIIKIDDYIDIGISMKYKPHRNRIEVTGIHLDKEYILNKHQLASPNHDCTCLDNFESDIDDLKIGNIDQDKNRIKDLQKRHEIMKKENDMIKKENHRLKQLLKKDAINKHKNIRHKQVSSQITINNNTITQFPMSTSSYCLVVPSVCYLPSNPLYPSTSAIPNLISLNHSVTCKWKASKSNKES